MNFKSIQNKIKYFFLCLIKKTEMIVEPDIYNISKKENYIANSNLITNMDINLRLPYINGDINIFPELKEPKFYYIATYVTYKFFQKIQTDIFICKNYIFFYTYSPSNVKFIQNINVKSIKFINNMDGEYKIYINNNIIMKPYIKYYDCGISSVLIINNKIIYLNGYECQTITNNVNNIYKINKELNNIDKLKSTIWV